MRELGGDANCVTDGQTHRRTQPFIVKDNYTMPCLVKLQEQLCRMKVKGIERLRVVDGSAMPLIVGGNTNAPIIHSESGIKQFLYTQKAYP